MEDGLLGIWVMRLFFGFGLVASIWIAQAATQVVPPNLANTEGLSSTSVRAGLRMQTIYESRLFTDFGQGGANISEMRLRADGSSLGFSSTAELEVRLSTTTSSEIAYALNSSGFPMFTGNVGIDETVVFPRSLLSLNSGPGNPNSFSVVIPFATQFRYNPTQGNLLVDFLVYDLVGNPDPRFDAQTGGGDGMITFAGGVSNSFGIQQDFGAVAQFTFEPVPEPSSQALITFALLGAVYQFRRKNAKAGQ